MKRRWVSIVALVVVFGVCSASFACPMCKDSVPTSDAAQAGSLPSGFNNSVYFILFGFLSVLGTVVALIVKAIRETGTRPAFQVIERNSAPRESDRS